MPTTALRPCSLCQIVCDRTWRLGFVRNRKVGSGRTALVSKVKFISNVALRIRPDSLIMKKINDMVQEEAGFVISPGSSWFWLEAFIHVISAAGRFGGRCISVVPVISHLLNGRRMPRATEFLTKETRNVRWFLHCFDGIGTDFQIKSGWRIFV